MTGTKPQCIFPPKVAKRNWLLKTLFAFGILAYTTLLCACNIIPHTGIIGAHAISGDVIDGTTGAPVRGAEVCARYEKLSLRYYVRGLTHTDANGHFEIAANPERVRVLEDPTSAAPSLSVSHSNYRPHMLIFHDFTKDERLTIKLYPREPGTPDDPYITCSDSAITPSPNP